MQGKQNKNTVAPLVSARSAFCLLTVTLAIALSACGGAQDAEVGADAASTDKSVVSQAVRGVASYPTGFATGVTGGGNVTPVRVSTPDQLKHELCRTVDANGCTDDTPRVIEIASIIDFTDSEGTGTTPGCIATDVCTASNVKSEIMLTIFDWQKSYCTGKSITNYTYKKAGISGLLVGSNKTVIGIGANAGIKGKGLTLKGSKITNVIVRNLKITDINEGMVWGGDAITITNATNVWIDHNYVARIGRMFLVTGTGDLTGVADNLTISNNEFDGQSPWSARCDGNHYWTMLMAGNGKATIRGNYFHHFSGRGPRIHPGAPGSTTHIVNNYFETGGWHALDYDGSTTFVLMEGNYFKDVPAPVVTPASGAGQLFAFYRQNDATKASCQAAIGRWCNVNLAVPMPSQTNMTQDSSVLSAVKDWASKIVKPYSAADVPDTVKAHAGVGRI